MQRAVIGLWLLVLGSSALDICDRQEDGTRLAHPLECAKYVVCLDQRTSQIVSCPSGLHFNRHVGACDLKSRAGCELSVRASEGLGAATTDCCSCCCNNCCTDSPTPGPDSTAPGLETTTPCPDSNTPSSESTAPSPEPTTTTPSPGSITPGPLTGPSGTSCNHPGLCAGQKDGTMFADSSSNGYIVCQCECEIRRPCPAGLVFNTAVNVCDWPRVH